MKKALSLLLTAALLLVSLLSLASCGKKNDETVLQVGYLSGSTGLGLSKMIADNKDNPKLTFTKYNSPSEIMAAFSNGSVDLAALPTNAFPNFASQMNGKRPISMLAINTLGVLYLLSDDGKTIPANDLSSLSGKTVYVPESAPKLILQHVLQAQGIENVTLNMEYDLDTLPAAAQTDSNVHYILFPEPKVTVLLNTAGSKTYSIALDLTEAWAATGDDPLVQGCMIVSRQFAADHEQLISSFLTEYEASINWMKNAENIDAAAQYAVDAGIFPKAPIAKQAIPRCNLTFLSGNTMKSTANAFFTALGLTTQPTEAYYGANE